ncbi:hypothetical protein [Thermococcus sp.]|uniref:hypothetical protein n=1 Tax=Thermococcus sp. TaxID=35749 RepID=UPI0026394FC9|nr:hypothetical protein [Thermococcus sp.]
MVYCLVVFASLLGLSLALLTIGTYKYYSKPRIRRSEGVIMLNPNSTNFEGIHELPEDFKRTADVVEHELALKFKQKQQKSAILLIKIALIGIIISIIGLFLFD